MSDIIFVYFLVDINKCVGFVFGDEGDDCISIVSGSENVRATGITCGPGHGIRSNHLSPYFHLKFSFPSYL